MSSSKHNYDTARSHEHPRTTWTRLVQDSSSPVTTSPKKCLLTSKSLRARPTIRWQCECWGSPYTRIWSPKPQKEVDKNRKFSWSIFCHKSKSFALQKSPKTRPVHIKQELFAITHVFKPCHSDVEKSLKLSSWDSWERAFAFSERDWLMNLYERVALTCDVTFNQSSDFNMRQRCASQDAVHDFDNCEAFNLTKWNALI
jgi:hypothetical protein